MSTHPSTPGRRRRARATSPRRARRATPVVVLALLASLLVLGGGDGVVRYAVAQPAAPGDPVVFGPRQAVPQLPCGPDDAPETDLQGRVPPADLASGRALQPYTCNLELVGRLPSTAYANFDALGDCAFWGREVAAGGTQVVDVSDPALPIPTAVLATPAMLDPWESLRVHAGRGLLVADSQVYGFLDIYDVSGDCRQPRLLSSTPIGEGTGHEGWFSPDGMTYYMSAISQIGPATIRPVDISDPTDPQVLAVWEFEHQPHGGWTSEDGTRSYICEQAAPPDDALLVVDTSEVAERRPDPRPHVISSIPLGDNQWCQNAYRLTYDGHPYLLVFGERGGAPDCSRAADGWATHAYPRFYDLADETAPVHVADALLEVQLPEHCAETTGEGVQTTQFGYSVHYCSPDRLYDPTILACSWFGSGLRVLDIRDPHNPVEIGYYNAASPSGLEAVGTAARPVIRSDRGEIWFAAGTAGFHVVRFRDGIWPFPASPPCPEFPDLWFAHYNEGSACPTATTAGVGQPAPEGRVPLPRDLQRLDGGGAGDPVGQAVDLSQRLFDDGEADRVVLATAAAFADALAGAPLAGERGPMLLTAGDGPLDPRVGEEIRRVTGGDGVVVTLGGPAAVAEPVAAAAHSAAGDRGCEAPLPGSCRIAGGTREATAARIAEVVVAEHPDAPPVALVARRDDPADALTGGAFAAAAGVPVLLTPTDGAHPDTTAFFAAHPDREAIALGGEAAVADATLRALPAAGHRRVAGPDRAATGVAIAEELWADPVLGAGLGGGRAGALLVNVRAPGAWPTALTAAVAAARLDLPVLGVETPPAALPPTVRTWLAGIDGPVMVAGDQALVSDEQLVAAGEAR